MLKIKEYKGITLIALVISIIVLLILAGVTINAISGSDLAPAKANEASQKNDIGAAKDDISLTATNAKLQGMENAYVGNGVSAGDASTTVGTEVIKAVAQKYQTNNQVGKATIEIENFGTIENVTANATVSVYTTDFIIEGTITLEDGNLTWGEIEQNIPRISGMPTQLELNSNQLPYTINATLKGTTGSITWGNGGSSIVNVSNGTLSLAIDITESSVTTNITASAEGCETKTCEVTITKVATPQVGDIVNYSPSGQFNWQAKYVSSDLADADTNGDGIGDKDILLASGTTYSNLTDTEKEKYDSTSNMSITQWKILNYDSSTKTVEIVPTASVGSLRLQGAQGYNNAVKMLNDACSNLYSTSSKNITARSINEEDFVKAGKHENTTDTDSNNKWTRYRESYINTSITPNITYDNTKSSVYTKANSKYPNIHASEYGNGLGNSVTCGLSEQTGNLIERTIKVNNIDTENTKFQADNGIQPKQTYYRTQNRSTNEVLLDDNKKNVLLPGTDSYWVASRCVLLNDGYCDFRVHRIHLASWNADYVYRSKRYHCRS